MTLKNSFSFHQVFAPLLTSQSSTSSSLRAQNHNQGPVQLTGLFKAPSKASSAQAEAEGTQLRQTWHWSRQSRIRSSLKFMFAKQHKEYTYSSLPPQCCPSHLGAGPLHPSASFIPEKDTARHLRLTAHLSPAMWWGCSAFRKVRIFTFTNERCT